ncbi:MAG: HEPN domain-containing protein [Candidatus Hadarchaeales archaeon]
MTELGFLSRLRKEGRLKLVDPSDDVKKAYFQKSESHLASAKLLLKHDRLEEAVSMAYYSMYHALTALLYRVGIKCENHTASITLLDKVFKIDASEISRAKKERIDKQYYVDFHLAREDVQDLIDSAERFRAMILDFTEKLTNEKVAEFRKMVKRLIGGARSANHH